MGKRGPQARPLAEKKARGTYEPHRDDKQEAALLIPPGAPPMPKGLDATAKRRWEEIVGVLVPLGTLSQIDGGALEGYCRSFSRWLKTEKEAFRNPTGEAAVEARHLHKEVIQPLETALGLHYAARCKMKQPEKPKEQDPVEKDLFGPPPGGQPAPAPNVPAVRE